MDKRAKHIAIIMDGNGRWAQAQGLPRSAGHKAGSEIIQDLCKTAIEMGIECLTLFGLSCDNLKRPEQELQYILDLTCHCIEQYLPDLMHQGVKLEFVGDIESLGENIYHRMQKAMLETAENTRLTLVIAMNFSGRWHVCHTTRKLLEKGEVLSDQDIQSAYQSLLPSSPDILIRTGGERRLSDFIMFHLAYTELFFLDIKWPDFRKEHLLEVLENFYQIDRRYGQIKEALV